MRYDRTPTYKTKRVHLSPDHGRYTLCGQPTGGMFTVNELEASLLDLCPRCSWIVDQVAGYLNGSSQRAHAPRRIRKRR